MTSYIPSMPTLAQISTNDTINYKGNHYAISSITSVTDNGGGRTTAIVVINDGNNTSLTLQTKDTVLSKYNIDQAGVQHAVWVQSVKA